MEEYERDDSEYSNMGSTDSSEGEDGVDKSIRDENNDGELDINGDESDDSSENGRGDDGEGEPGSGDSSNGDEESSADDDEDSKLRALLHQVGRTYQGYCNSEKVIRYRMRRTQKKKQQHSMSRTTAQNYSKSNLATGNDNKTLTCLSHNSENVNKGNGIVPEINPARDNTATKSTFFGQGISGNMNTNPSVCLKEGSDENSKPKEDAEVLGYSAVRSHSAHVPGEGEIDQWMIDPGVMEFIVH